MRPISDHKEKIFYAILSGFILFFVFISFKFIIRYEDINEKSDRLSRKEHLDRSNVTPIKDWMTFGYINKIYNLPQDYLKDKIGITNKKYPNMLIDKQNLEAVREAVSSFDTKIENK